MAKIELYIICVVTIHISSRIMKTMLPPPLMHQKRLRLHQHQYFLCEMKYKSKSQIHLRFNGKDLNRARLGLNQ